MQKLSRFLFISTVYTTMSSYAPHEVWQFFLPDQQRAWEKRVSGNCVVLCVRCFLAGFDTVPQKERIEKVPQVEVRKI
jgi:hypothetical protein